MEHIKTGAKADNDSEQQRKQRQFDSRRQGFAKQIHHAVSETDGIAEIAGEDIADPDQILHRNRLIEAMKGPHSFHFIGHRCRRNDHGDGIDRQ